MKLIQVAALVLENQCEEILIGQRRKGDSNEGKWEFPGGKLQDGESFEKALIREINEELGLQVTEFSLFEEVTYRYPMIHVHIQFFYTRMHIEGGLQDNAHEKIQWVEKSKLQDFDFLEANQIVIEKLHQAD